MKKIILVTIFILSTIVLSQGTTFHFFELPCPICDHRQAYAFVGSYGSYIYNDPSKFQYLFWPKTTDLYFYCCQKCYYSNTMYEFYNLDTTKKDIIAKTISDNFELDEVSSYYQIPLLDRLKITEKVSDINGRSQQSWNELYRIIAFHYDKIENDSMAHKYWTKSLSTFPKMLQDTSSNGKEKEIYLKIGAVYRKLKNYDSSLYYLNLVKQDTFDYKGFTEIQQKNTDDYLNKLSDDLIMKLNEEHSERK